MAVVEAVKADAEAKKSVAVALSSSTQEVKRAIERSARTLRKLPTAVPNTAQNGISNSVVISYFSRSNDFSRSQSD